MADIFKTIPREDIVTTKSIIHEYFSVTGTIFSGAYGTFPDDTNVKTYYHNMFETVYDYPYLSSSANNIVDITLGVYTSSEIYDSGSSAPITSSYSGSKDSYAEKKNNIYNVFAQSLLGFSMSGTALIFDADGDHITTTSDKYYDTIFMAFSKLLVKDGIKKGSFELQLGMNPYTSTCFADFDWDGGGDANSILKITDSQATSSYLTNSNVGDYAVLYAENYTGSTPLDSDLTTSSIKCGLIFYNPGVIVLDAWLFDVYNATSGYGYLGDASITTGTIRMLDDIAGAASAETDYYHIADFLRGYEITSSDEDISITSFADGLRKRILNVSFSNTVEINSTRYNCRISPQDFNYSSNPSYLSGSKIRVKDTSEDEPKTYITSVGLYSADDELLAVSKLSQPIKKDPATPFTLVARLDY